MICRRSRICLYTLNGDMLLDQAVCEKADDCILSCAFYEGASNEWLPRELLFTGHRRGLVNVSALVFCLLSLYKSGSNHFYPQVWSLSIRNGQFELDMIRQLHHVDSNREDRGNVSAGITCILPLPQVVYTGDEAGSVVSFLFQSYYFLSPRVSLLTGDCLFMIVRVGLRETSVKHLKQANMKTSMEASLTRLYGLWISHFFLFFSLLLLWL